MRSPSLAVLSDDVPPIAGHPAPTSISGQLGPANDADAAGLPRVLSPAEEADLLAIARVAMPAGNKLPAAGEAIIARNVGGRVNDSVIYQIAALGILRPLGDIIVVHHMDLGRLVSIARVEEEAIGPRAKDSRHETHLSRAGRT